MLTAAVQAGHDDGAAVAFTGSRLDQTLQVGEMIIRRHMVHTAEQLVGQAVVAGVHHKIQVIAAQTFLDETLCVTGLEAGADAGDDEGVLLHSQFMCPAHQMCINLVCQLFRAGYHDQADVRHLSLNAEKVIRAHCLSHVSHTLLIHCVFVCL